MPKEIFPSSYLCDCGYQCDFLENTVREMKRMSMKRKGKQILVADDDQHKVVFEQGEWIDLVCPHKEK